MNIAALFKVPQSDITYFAIVKVMLLTLKNKFNVFHTSNRSVTYSVLQIDRRSIERVA